MRMIDLTGLRFGMLVVVRREGAKRNGSTTAPTWTVRCDCGMEKVVSGPNLRRGQTTSCGCRQLSHGMYGTPEYKAWVSMVQRCTNPRARNYQNYGGRGIRVCNRWSIQGGAAAFLADMGPRPSDRHSLDRRNNEGDYEPGNCWWAPPKEQQRNKRTSRVLTVEGVSATVAEWAERTGVGRSTIRERLKRGWAPERAVRP